MKRRIIAFIMCLAVLISSNAFPVFAAETPTQGKNSSRVIQSDSATNTKRLAPTDPNSSYPVNTLVSRLYNDPTGQVHYVRASVSSQISIDNHATIILTLYNNTTTYDHGTYYSPYTTGTYFERYLTADYGDSDNAEAQFIYNFVGYPRYDCDLTIDYEI